MGAISAVQGVSGWYFTLFDVSGLDDFDRSLAISMLALPATLLLIVLDFRTTTKRGVLWTWVVLRAVAVPLLGLGVGSLLRVWLGTESGETHALIDPHASDYAWQLAVLGAALLAVQPLVSGVRRIAVALFGALREETPSGTISAETTDNWSESPVSTRK